MKSIKSIYETYAKVLPKGSLNKITSSLQICIVDDDANFSEMLVDFLGEHGIHAKEFRSGEEFLNFMPSDDNLLVILDYYFELSSIDGLEVLKQIKRRSPALPVIFLSGNDDLETALETLRNGALDYFVKSNRTVFAQIIAAILKVDQLRKGSLN
jgi:two-component system, NtrC family, nitrogen regulation response regulator NtrX